jgi:acyl-CoA synthetase (NDP forming)
MQEALRRQVDRALRPRGVAVVGASRTPSMITTMLHNIRNYGFEGDVCAVNPRYLDVDGIPCYPSLLDVPFEIDHALVAVPNRVVPAVLSTSSRAGTPRRTTGRAGRRSWRRGAGAPASA